MKLIDKDAILNKSQEFTDDTGIWHTYAVPNSFIEEAPTISERPDGYWKIEEIDDDTVELKCSVCNNSSMFVSKDTEITIFKYCPYCGAKIKQE